MKKNQWPIRLASGALVVLTLAGVALATETQGTQSDPLVSLSYLTDVVTPSVLAEVDSTVALRESELVTQLEAVATTYAQEVESTLTGGASGQSTSNYTVLTLSAGQKVTGSIGTEFLLRGGTGTCIADSVPGLINMTDGTTLSNGGALLVNNLYLSTVDGRGVQATTDVVLLVKGTYTVS